MPDERRIAPKRADQLAPGDRLKPLNRQLGGRTVASVKRTPDGLIEISWGMEIRSVVPPDKIYQVLVP